MSLDLLALVAPAVVATLIAAVKALADRTQNKERQRFVEEIEKRALEISALETDSSKPAAGGRAPDGANLISTTSLLALYVRQIEQYQTETRARASWSFYVALLAMFFGFGFIAWGGFTLISSEQRTLAGSLIAAIGGAVSTYITKTFLEVHTVSLSQMNRYFEQPVINDSILMMERVASMVKDPAQKQKIYDQIVASLVDIVKQRIYTDSRLKLPSHRKNKALPQPVANEAVQGSTSKEGDSAAAKGSGSAAA